MGYGGIHYVIPNQMTPAQYREACRLTMREQGNMMYDLRCAYKGTNRGMNNSRIERAWLLQIRNEKGVLVAQALLDVSRNLKTNKLWVPFAQFYVRKADRRKGLAERLYKECWKIVDKYELGSMKVQPWSDPSIAFFSAMKGDRRPARNQFGRAA